MGFFNPEVKHHYHVVELDPNNKLPELTADLREGLRALVLNPAFKYLMHRFRIKKAAMQTTLNEGFKLDDIQLRYCQAGIYWAGDLERDIKVLTQEQPTTRVPVADEMAAFKQVAKSITLVGQDDSNLQG